MSGNVLGCGSDVNLTVIDPYSRHIDMSSTSRCRSVDLRYAKSDNKMDSIRRRGQEIIIRYPVSDCWELLHQRHLTADLGYIARQSGQVATIEQDQIDAVFDQIALDLARPAFAAEGVLLDSCPVNEKYVKSFLLHEIRDMNSMPKLERYLNNNEQIASQVGFESIPDQSTFHRYKKQLELRGDYLQKICAAATRVAHIACRNGVPLPDNVRTIHRLDLSPVIDENEVLGGTRRKAITNWMEESLDDLLEPISFNRGKNASISVKQIVGILAQGAYVGSLDAAPDTAAWYYDEDELPSATHISDLIDSLDRTDIIEMFQRVNLRFARIASDLGFFQTTPDVALDETWIPAAGEDYEDVMNTYKCETGQGWKIGALCLIDRDQRFVLGTDLITDRVETNKYFRRLLSIAGAETNGIGRIHADRGFESESSVDMCRAYAGSNWAIRLRRQSHETDDDNNGIKDNNRLKKRRHLIDECKKGEPNFERGFDYASLDRNPNFYAHPIPGYIDNNEAPHMYFLTDLDSNLESIFETYLHRWSIETYFRQVKHGFLVPSESPSPNIRLFLFNIATLIYNIHTLINRSPSPKYGLRLDVPKYEVLLGIIESAYSRSPATAV